MKRCGHCLRFLPSSEFYRRCGGKDPKLAAWCKTCTLHAANSTPPMHINPAPLTLALTTWRPTC